MEHDEGVGAPDVGEPARVAPLNRLSQRVERVDTMVISLPTEGGPESDGTAVWDHTTMVLVEVHADGVTGLGYTYESAAASVLVRDLLAGVVVGLPVAATGEAATRMARAIRNQGSPGVASAAIAAVDVALWDLAARLVEVPLAHLLGVAREQVPIYASGGFTSSDLPALADELRGYCEQDHQRVKIKIGREPQHDVARVRCAREVLGPDVGLMVDANGAYERKQALTMAESFAGFGVDWFEEPVSSDDLEGLRLLRDRAPARMTIAAGEYGYDPVYFRRLLESGAVDVLQADATRCRGVSGFRHAAALAEAFGLPLSAHCAPALHVHLGAAVARLTHIEWFRDHVRMEARLFEGVPTVSEGYAAIDPRRPGLGLELRRREAARYVQ